MLLGVLHVGSYHGALLRTSDQEPERWRVAGGWYGDYEVETITATGVGLKHRSGNRITVELAPELVAGLQLPPGSDKAAWANSKANPFVRRAPSLPTELFRSPDTLTDYEWEAVGKWYKAYGFTFKRMGSTTQVEQDYAELRRQRQDAKREAFVATLTEEQKALYRGTAQKAIRLDAILAKQGPSAADKEEWKAQQETAQRNRERLIESLTPEQREVYLKLGDVTEPLPPDFGKSKP